MGFEAASVGGAKLACRASHWVLISGGVKHNGRRFREKQPLTDDIRFQRAWCRFATRAPFPTARPQPTRHQFCSKR
ncbi:hypothetical protein L596_030820 [Steinernema carpocapsae]|uniref:Uncharacterized protein n=1 Tax=Steinernema carpocapsae TaxID=34508 RepID=A0A4U5LNV6_STECR|nr:hypothetical protein L596_030820 [Steinernema carpocapsae]